MGVGPRNAQEAYRIWQDLSKAHWGLEEFLAQYDRLYPDGELPLDSVIKRYRQPLQPGQDILVDAALSRLAFKVEDAVTDTRVSAECLDILACNQCVVVPLVTGEQVVGVIVADNLYKDRDISPWDMRLLRLFANHAAMALQNAATYAKLQDNIDQLKAVQEQLIQAERLSAIGQMTAKVAHEIRNPLVTIGGFARSVLKGLEKDSPQSRRCEIIVEETMRLEEILGSLLDFSRQRDLNLEDCRIEKIVARACTLVRDDLVRNKVVIQRDIQKGLPDLLLDVHKIVQVLINLIKNAIQAMKEGGEITLSAHLQGRFVSLKVADTGAGIPPGILSNIFNPFFTTKSEGFGLGLAISRNYIYDHGGNISVQSRVGEGTVFDILLPLPSVPRRWRKAPPGKNRKEYHER
jgi:signal transduction histidine kinase